LRLTDEYWETYYIDYYSLLVVDHPQESHIYVDERVADPPAPLKLYVTGEPRNFASAKDDAGRDVSGVIQRVDAKYLNSFGVGQYQGLTRDHWVELELPEDAPRTGPLYLIGDGFLHPWDDTITMARTQGSGPAPQDLSIEVPDRTGHWLTARNRLGIPAGRLAEGDGLIKASDPQCSFRQSALSRKKTRPDHFYNRRTRLARRALRDHCAVLLINTLTPPPSLTTISAKPEEAAWPCRFSAMKKNPPGPVPR
jgi:hypothetical protein